MQDFNFSIEKCPCNAVHQKSCCFLENINNKLLHSRTRTLLELSWDIFPVYQLGCLAVDKCSDEWWVKDGAGWSLPKLDLVSALTPQMTDALRSYLCRGAQSLTPSARQHLLFQGCQDRAAWAIPSVAAAASSNPGAHQGYPGKCKAKTGAGAMWGK